MYYVPFWILEGSRLQAANDPWRWWKATTIISYPVSLIAYALCNKSTLLLFKTNLTFFHNILCSLSAAVNWSIHCNLQNETLYDGGFGVLESEMARIRLLLNYRCDIPVPAFLNVNILNLILASMSQKECHYLPTYMSIKRECQKYQQYEYFRIRKCYPESIETADIILKIKTSKCLITY